jgi:prevent-host-death family protein
MITKTSAEAQNKFGQLLDLAQREPIAITRHGRPAAFIVSPRDMEVLMAMKANRRPGVSAFEEWTSKFSNQISPEAAELTDEDVVRMVHEARLEAARNR